MNPFDLVLILTALWVLTVLALMAGNHAAHRKPTPTTPTRDRRMETVSCPNF